MQVYLRNIRNKNKSCQNVLCEIVSFLGPKGQVSRHRWANDLHKERQTNLWMKEISETNCARMVTCI